MYCREDYSEDHMNPFTENSCCLFKIGAKKMSLQTSRSSNTTLKSNSENKSTKKIVLLIFAGLLAWLVLSPLILMLFIPYLAFKKLLRVTVIEKGSYLLALKKNGNQAKYSSETLSNWLLFLIVIIVTPVLVAFAYVFGIGYLFYLMCYPNMPANNPYDL